MWTLSEKAHHVRETERAAVNEVCKAKKVDPINEYELDLRLFGKIPFANPLKHEYLLRCFGHQWPEAFVIEADGCVNYWVVRMAKSFCKFKRLNVLGCASSGKSFFFAGATYTRWKSEPFSSSIYLSTTSAEAGEARAFGTVKDLFHKDKYQVGKLISSLRLITLDEETRNDEGNKERDVRNCVKAVLIKPGAEGKNVVGTICGRKNRSVTWCCDEFPFMDLGTLDARVNLFSNDFAQWIGIGNGPEEGDPLYIDGEPFGPEFPDGWRSVNPDVHEYWPTKTGFALYFNGHKSPNLLVPKGRKGPFPSIMNWAKLQEIEQVAGGTDTPIYWRQVIGLSPGVDVPDKIVTHKLLESNGAFKDALWAGLDQKVVAGLDLGFREGGDPTTIDFCKIGAETTGRRVAEFERDAIPLLPVQSSKDAFENQIAKRVISECRKRNCHDLALDVTGDGGILLQHIERQAREESYKLAVIPVSFSGTADDSIVIEGERRSAREMFANKVSQLWAQFRVCVINGVIRGCSMQSKAVGELCGRKFSTDEKKRFVIEKKSEFKKRLRHSPDRGDARVLATHLALKMGLSGASPVKAESEAIRRDAMRPQAKGYSGHVARPLYGGR